MRHHNLIFIFSALVCLVCATGTFAQISGFLTAPNGTPVAGADVFINHTTCYSTSDEEGRYSLQDVPPGFHELIAWKGGFAMYRLPMRVSAGQAYNLNIQFPSTEKPTKGKSSVATQEAFNRAILGTEGSLVYPEGTQVMVEARDGKFRVQSGPVVVEYPAAGYRIIGFFSASEFQDVLDAPYLYQDLPVYKFAQKLEVEKTRQQMFKGSLRHWLQSVMNGAAAEEGFQTGDGLLVSVKPDSINSLTRISFPSPMKLSYSGQVSTITTTKAIEVNSNGLILNPVAVRVEGPMAKHGLSNQLPLDFRPVKDIEAEFAAAMRYFYEKVSLHTDRPYYYAGESLWWKAYINYFHPEFRDSLSKVLHVELLTPDRGVVAYGRYLIENGISHGNFVIPDHVASGMYYLRAYTNLQLNFGHESLYTKPLHVLDLKNIVKPDPTYKSPPDVGMVIQPDKDLYKVRDKIRLTIQLESGLQHANLSVSVTDAAQAVPLHEPILPDTYDVVAEEIPTILELTHRVERGVSFDAQFLNNQGRGEKAVLTFFQFKTGEVLQIETDSDGRFWQTGLQLLDSTEYSWKSDKAKGRPYGKLVILARKVPALQTVAGPRLEFLQVSASSDPDVPRGSRLLDPVQITDSRINPVPAKSVESRPFGKANYTVTFKQLNINAGNLMLALVGKVPGLMVSPTQRMIYFRRAEGTSVLNPGVPLVTVNDVPMVGDPYTTLESLDFNTIESIEFHNRINSLYGTAGAYGVISVYTRTGEEGVGKIDPTLQTIVLPGFSKADTFRGPDYEKSTPSRPDQRPTLYWSPDVRIDPATGRATVTFFASDMPGMYRVVAEGVTIEGWPLRAETFVIVEDRK